MVPTGDVDRTAAARWVVPVALGAVTWLLLALTAGVLLTLRSLSPIALLAPVVLGLLAYPVYRLRPWTPGVTDRVLASARRRRRQLAGAAGLFVLVRLPVVADALSPVFEILLLPLRAVPGVLYGVTVLYGAALGEPAGELLFSLGRLYAELLWLFALAAGVAALFPGPDRQGGEP